MEAYKQEFIEFMVDSHVLKFGEFILKSGRKSPFFMNAGAYVTGTQLRKLGEYYAKAIHEHYGDDFDVLFGPAYKGIPLGVVTAIAYSNLYGKEIRYCSNRKEVKDHGGDKGILLGSELNDGDKVVIIEDVTTSGKSMDETVPIIRAQAKIEIKGLMVSLNRMERGKGEKSALEEIKDLYGFETNAIVSMQDVVEYLYNKPYKGKVYIDDEIKKSISKKYFKKSDIIQIIHIVDLDGTYIDPNNVVYHDNDKIEYCSDCIKTKNVQGTINRNNCKARILNKLSSTNIINGIPYRIFFFSTNLEHVLHNVQNATREEKNNLAQNFEDRFYDKPKDFIKFINNKDFAINKEYEETWNFIKKENNSLKRYTNFNLYFIDETK